MLVTALLMLSLSAFGGLVESTQAFSAHSIELSHSQSTAPTLNDIEPFDNEKDLLAFLAPLSTTNFQLITPTRSPAFTSFCSAQLKPPPDLV